MNRSPPIISLSSVEDTISRSSSSINRSVAHDDVPISYKNSHSSSTSLGEKMPRGQVMTSPHDSVISEPQFSTSQTDVISLSSDILSEGDAHFNQYTTGEHTQRSSSLLSAHSANAACSLNSTSSNRVRSGSLFSTNSIWNDENILGHSPDRSVSSGGNLRDFVTESSFPGTSISKHSVASFLNPSIIPQSSPYGVNNHSRNRSHTTSGSSYGNGCQNGDFIRSNMSPLLHIPKDESMPNIDKLYLNSFDTQNQGNRNRSQTYSGVNPKLSQSALPNIISGVKMTQSSESTSHNLIERQKIQQGVFQNSSLDKSSHFVNSHADPFLQDDFNFLDLSITTDFELPSMCPTNTLLFDNVPQFFNASKLYQLLINPSGMLLGNNNHGVLGVHVAQASNSKMALIVCSSVEIAMNFKANYNHFQVASGTILYVAFAKVSKKSTMKAFSSINGMVANNILPQETLHENDSVRAGSKDFGIRDSLDEQTTDKSFYSIANKVYSTCVHLSGASKIDLKGLSSIINTALQYPQSAYKTNFGPLPQPGATRRFDAAKIRDVRKSLELYEKSPSGQHVRETDNEQDVLTQTEVEALVLDMLEELPELTYDHIGNTIIQKLFAIVQNEDIRLMMVKKILPYFAQLGIHKNGTWAIQMIINSSQNVPRQMALIAESLRPYSVKLFNDQFGNYVLQCCLNFGSPYNDFIFEAICNNFIEISSGRFGARCLRTILETLNENKSDTQDSASREQLLLVAGLIVQYANELVVNSNGTLLITWFMDTFHGMGDSMPDQRANLLSQQLFPFLDKYCVHKQANVIIFKLLSNSSDPSVRKDIMQALFLPFDISGAEQSKGVPRLMVSVLKESCENSAGPMFVQKVLSTPSLFEIGNDKINQKYHQFAVSQVKNVLLDLQVGSSQPYKKLFDEVGLSSNKLGKASQGTRRIKRMFGSLRNSQSNSPFNYPMPEYSYTPLAYSPMPVPVGYPPIGIDNHMSYPIQYANMGYHPSHVKGQSSSHDAQVSDYYLSASRQPDSESPYGQDAHMMRQLEKLSLQSAAMGYVSNPGTPGAGNNQNHNSFF